ncbi:pentapeptide repeat-containing protein [Rathayibacter sp. VKM Ac-2926]|uniref:pentapeptide repeat-containing protein n=1 Tax=Rathayibacter sp. VKM Ac-2926 TaxID=2929477 RepID=UPI0035AB7C45
MAGSARAGTAFSDVAFAGATFSGASFAGASFAGATFAGAAFAGLPASAAFSAFIRSACSFPAALRGADGSRSDAGVVSRIGSVGCSSSPDGRDCAGGGLAGRSGAERTPLGGRTPSGRFIARPARPRSRRATRAAAG